MGDLNKRYVIVKFKDSDTWVVRMFSELKEGALFYLYNEDGSRVQNPKTHEYLFLAKSDIKIGTNGYMFIDYE